MTVNRGFHSGRSEMFIDSILLLLGLRSKERNELDRYFEDPNRSFERRKSRLEIGL